MNQKRTKEPEKNWYEGVSDLRTTLNATSIRKVKQNIVFCDKKPLCLILFSDAQRLKNA